MMERIFPDAAVLSGAALEHELLAAAPQNRHSSRPWVSFNFIASVDGAATLDGLSGQLGNAWDQRVFSLLRQSADVILVGAQTIRAEGVTVFLVEQNANKALAIADRGYVLENGRVVLEDTGTNLLTNPEVRKAYLGA